MQFETTDDPSAQDNSAGPPAATTAPYETERQARADVAGVCAQRERSSQRGVMGEANLAYLREACDRTNVTLGAFDTRILAGWPDGNQKPAPSSPDWSPAHTPPGSARQTAPGHFLNSTAGTSGGRGD